MNQELKELLELAAKACGYRVSFDTKFNTFYWDRQEVSDEFFEWRPDLDDGDGARVEAELELRLSWGGEFVFVQQRQLPANHHASEWYKNHNGNRQAARRMASLRVAAEAGRRMKT